MTVSADPRTHADEDATAFSREGAAWVWEAVSMRDAPEHDSQYEQWATAISEAKHQRQGAVKTACDPHNLLRYNKNITPGNAGHPGER
ncbi:hypothetical protein OG607_39250 [Streptomyces sp. NBC_01537]|uniref:hypothetical protein n=1 Tax=Streptomyces sp. NBC_01537 TaxID=2903896 RepID=UPI00386CCB09